MQIIINKGIGIHTITGSIFLYAMFGIICLLAVIGFFTILKWIFIGKKKKPKEPKETNLERNVKRIERDMQELKRQINQK